MAKRPTLPTISATHLSAAQVNTAFDAIKTAFDNTLSLDGSTPNSMDADLDMNGNDLLNVGVIAADDITIDGTNVSGVLERAEDAAAAAQAAAIDSSGVQAYGAVGDGTTSDQAAFVAALAATTGPVYVPWTANEYNLSSLSAANSARLWGPGKVMVAGVERWISSDPWINNTRAITRSFHDDWQPSKWSSVDGSLHNGAESTTLKRTGGWGTYGADLTSVLVSAETPSPQFDVVRTSWATHQNLTGGSVFGAWTGANSPSSALGQVYSGGSTVGMEINTGNRWGDNGLKADIGGVRDFVGLKIVPDVIPAADGATVSIYPGDFGIVIGKSNTGHKWWTGLLLPVNAIMPGGIGLRLRGGSVLGNAPGHLLFADGFYTNGAVFDGTFTTAVGVTGSGVNGLKMNNATFSGAAILLKASDAISWGGSSLYGGTNGFSLSIGNGGSISVPNDGHLYTANFARRAMRWGDDGSAAAIGFLGAAPIARVVLPAAATDAATTQALANAVRTALINFGFAS